MYVKGFPIANRYILGEVLGRGSFAEVWSAQDKTTQKEVAIKICKSALIAEDDNEREKSIQRFCEEIALMKRAKSKYVVEILDYGKEREDVPPHNWYYYIVMERMKTTLSAYIDYHRTNKLGGMKWEEFLQFAVHFISGINDLHEKGILHRDIKPSNLFFSNENILTIGDLGIARLSERSRATNTMFGTVGYAAPELFVHKKEASAPSDLFSIGVVFYEILALRHPCSDQGSFYLSKEVIRRLITADFYPLEEIRPDVPPELLKLIHRMIAFNPNDRPQTATEVLQTLQQIKQKWVQHYLTAGNEAMTQKNYPKAEVAFQTAVAIESETSITHSNLGLVYYLAGKFVEAKEEFTISLSFHPDDKVAYNNRGLCNYYLEKYDEAIRDFSHALQLDPKFAEAYNNRGLAYHKKKEYYKALQNFNRTASLTPQDPRSYNNRGLTYLEQKDFPKAQTDFAYAIRLVPDDPEPYFNRGLTYQRQNKYDLAIRDFNRAIELNPNDMTSYYQRGIAYKKLGDYAQALADFEIAYKMKPSSQNLPKYIQFCRQKLKGK